MSYKQLEVAEMKKDAIFVNITRSIVAPYLSGSLVSKSHKIAELLTLA